MQIIPRWFRNAKMLKPFSILCRSWVCHPSPSGSFPASQLWALNSCLPLGCCVIAIPPATVPTSQAHSLGLTSAVAYSCILTLCSAQVSWSVCAVHPPLPTLLNTSLRPCWLWWLLRLSTWPSTGHLPAQHVNLVTSSCSPTQSPSYHLKQELFGLTMKASHSELRYQLMLVAFSIRPLCPIDILVFPFLYWFKLSQFCCASKDADSSQEGGVIPNQLLTWYLVLLRSFLHNWKVQFL